MKIWVLTILMAREKLTEFANKIDMRVERLSLDMITETNELYSKIIFWNDIKRRVVNAKVLGDKILQVLNEEEREICLLYAKGNSMQDISENKKISKSSVSRKITSGAQKAAKALCGVGYDQNKLEQDYFDIDIISKTFKKLSSKITDATVKNQNITESKKLIKLTDNFVKGEARLAIKSPIKRYKVVGSEKVLLDAMYI